LQGGGDGIGVHIFSLLFWLGVGLVYRQVNKSQLELRLFSDKLLLYFPGRALAGGGDVD
jgi:hypothetical protein